MQRPLRPAAFLAFALVLAGCVQPSAVETASLGVDPAAAAGLVDVVAASASGALVAVPADLADLELRVELLDFESGEPTIGVTSDGTVFIPGPGASVMRSQDGGRTWEDVTDKGPLGPKTN